jgi:soluble lytic murein transglycosylase
MAGGVDQRRVVSRRVFGVLCVAALVATAVAHSSPLLGGASVTTDLDEVLAEPGRALRAGVDALERGEGLLADSLLAAVAAKHAVIADHADLLRMRLRTDAGRSHDAVAFRKQWRHDDSPLRADFHTLLGNAYASLDEQARARATWEYASLATRDATRLVALKTSIAESYLRSDQMSEAGDLYLDVWRSHPTAEGAEAASEGLEAIERVLGRTLRTAKDHRRRADALYRNRHNEEALAAYDQALNLGLRGKERTRARHGRAETLFRLRRYTEAEQAYRELPPTHERRIQRARALARSGRVSEGARQLEQLGDESRSSQATRALLLAGLLRDGEGEHDHARRLFRRVLQRAPRSDNAAAARWRLGWDAFRAADYDAAIAHFEALDAAEPDGVASLRPRYWAIRASEFQGDDMAPAAYAELARSYPLSYYGWRARQRIASDDAVRPRKAIAAGRTALAADDLARPRILLEAGLVEEAHDELGRLARRARGLDDRLALASLYADAGDFNRPQRLVVDAYTEQLARGPAKDQLELWWHAWPAPYADEMRGATESGSKIAPELVYSIMREESGYRPEVLSVSGARGLLQLMPTTAERVAREAQFELTSADALFQPSVNIFLGAWYLTSLLDTFEGRASAAIGSYNAGPHAVSRWIERGPQDDDVWVEEIPYDQTRRYVKRVLRSLHAYRVLY